MRSLLLLPLLGLLPATALAVPLDRRTESCDSKAPVCIVGAGPSGLTAARQLESRGYSTVIFEKQSLVGGKCQTLYDQYVALFLLPSHPLSLPRAFADFLQRFFSPTGCFTLL